MRSFPLLVLLALSACATDSYTGDTDTSDGYFETGDAETGDTSDTQDSVVETGDSTGHTGDSVDTADSGDTGVEPGLGDLQAWPSAMVVDVGATWPIRVIATDKGGTRSVYGAAVITADDPSVASVDSAGMVTALAEGSTTVRVMAEGLEVDLSVVVLTGFEAQITVVDGTSGAPIEGATVRTAAGDTLTDASGVAAAPVVDGAPATFTVWIDDAHYSVSVLDTVNRRFTVPLKVVADQEPTAQLHGDVDFAGVPDAGLGDEVFGLASGSVQGDLTLFDVEDLLAPTRTLNYHGVEADVPSNIFVENFLEDYYAQVRPGAVAAWGLGGPVSVAELAAGLNGTGDAMALIIDHLPDMTWGTNGGITAVAGADADAPLAPSVAFTDSLHVALPSLSTGFDGTEEELVCTFDGTADGYVLTGLGLGAGVMDIAKVPDGSVPGATDSAVFVMAQVGGLGSGGAVAVAVADASGSTVTFPELQDIPVINDWTWEGRLLDFTTDPAATLVHVVMVDKGGKVLEVWTDGSWSGSLDKHNPSFHPNNATVTLESYEVVDGTFEHWVSAGDLEPADLAPITRSVVMREP